MSEYALGILGIVVSIVLFLVGYRQTIGAKRERVRSANNEIEKILVRRIVLDGYKPCVEDVGRLIDGKARDFRVRPSDLLAEGQLLNNVFTRVVETDFIPSEQREAVLETLAPIIAEADEQPTVDIYEAFSSHAASRKASITMMTIMAIFASIVGSLTSIIPLIRDRPLLPPLQAVAELIPTALGTAALSFAIISFLMVVYRIRDRQQEVFSKASALSEHVDFERDVMDAVRKANIKARVAGPQNRGYDLLIESEGRKILVEVKGWRRPMPNQVVRSVLNRLREAMAQEDASEAILVTRSDIRVPNIIGEGEGIKIMTLRDLQSYLTRRP